MQKSDQNLRLFLVGDYGIGKRSLMRRLANDGEFLACTDKYNGEIFKLHLECAQALSDVPSDAFGVIMVYDLTHRTTFATAQKISEELQKTQNWPLRAIVGTFRDQQDQAQVQKEELVAIKQAHGCLCFEVSNTTGENVVTFQKQLAIRATFTYRQAKLVETSSAVQTTVVSSPVLSAKEQNVVQLKMYVIGMPGSGRKSIVENMLGQKRYWFLQDKGGNIKLGIQPVIVDNVTEIPTRGAFALMLVYNVTNPRTFEYALEISKYVAEKIRFPFKTLVGTHRDGERQISIAEGQTIKQRIQGFFMELSNKTQENVEIFKKQFEIRALQAYVNSTADEEEAVPAQAVQQFPKTQQQAPDEAVRPSAARQEQIMSLFSAGPVVKPQAPLQPSMVGTITTLDPAALDTQGPAGEHASSSAHTAQREVPEQRKAFEKQLEQQKKEMQELLEATVAAAKSVYEPDPMYQEEERGKRLQELNHLKSIGTQQKDETLYQEINSIQFQTLKARPSHICARVVPELLQKQQEDAKQQPRGGHEIFPMNPSAFSAKLIGLQPTRSQMLTERKAQKLQQNKVQISFVGNKTISEKLIDPDPVIVIEFEVGQKLLELQVKEDDNPFELAKAFVAKHNLDATMTRQITMLVIERLETHHEKRKNEYLENKRLQHQERISMLEQSMPKFKHLEDSRAKKAVKPIFKFELFVGTKGSTIAVRPGDDPHDLAEKFCNIMKLNRQQYYGFVVAKIQESFALYQLQREGHALE